LRPVQQFFRVPELFRSTLPGAGLTRDRNSLSRIAHFLNRWTASTGGQHEQEHDRDTASEELSHATGLF
jgi:hypothetical protein